MRKLMFAAVMVMVLLTGCRIMHPTVAESVIQVDKNCEVLFTNYVHLMDGAPEAEKIDYDHDKALMEATLVVTNTLREMAQEDYGIDDVAIFFIDKEIDKLVNKLKAILLSDDVKKAIEELIEKLTNR